jgi:thymidine kinase
MFSGKTTCIIDEYNEFIRTNVKVLVFNHKLDKRYDKSEDSYIITHCLKKIRCNQIDKINEIFDNVDYEEAKVIIIDEIQFFKDIVDDLMRMVEKDNKHVIIAGLITDYGRNIFGELINMIPFADKYEIKYSECFKCKEKGLFSQRLMDITTDGVDVGSSDKYIPLCRHHYLNNI